MVFLWFSYVFQVDIPPIRNRQDTQAEAEDAIWVAALEEGKKYGRMGGFCKETGGEYGRKMVENGGNMLENARETCGSSFKDASNKEWESNDGKEKGVFLGDMINRDQGAL